MTEESRPPVAIRSLRPYSSEADFLAEERDTLTRTAVTLIGAPSRPRGVVIRFELTLSDGSPLVRGEGRVLGFQPADEHGPSSLTLRFTRLDAKSKALVDRAAELREAASGESEAAAALSDTEPPVAPSPSVAPAADDGAPDPLASTSMNTAAVHLSEPPPMSGERIALSISSGNLPLSEVEEIGHAAAEEKVEETVPPPHEPMTPAETDRRDSLLDRLRVRAKTLSPTQVATILAVPRTSS